MTVTNPTITARNSKNFNSSGTNVLTLYNVSSEETHKFTGVIEMPLPMTDSYQKFVFDLMGAGREVTVAGKVTTADVGTTAGRTNLWKYAADLVGYRYFAASTLIDGDQGSTTTGQYFYTHDALNKGNVGEQIAVNVLVSETTIEATKGNPDSFDYSIAMVEFGTLV